MMGGGGYGGVGVEVAWGAGPSWGDADEDDVIAAAAPAAKISKKAAAAAAAAAAGPGRH